MKPSKEHPNRQAHNWLAYFHQDQSLARHATRLRGCVLDLGAGAGSYRNWCLKHADTYVAVDWQASLHTGPRDFVADLNTTLPIESEFAASAISFSVLEHLHKPEVMLSEAFRVLKPGGWLLLQVPWQWWLHEEPHDYYRYTPFALHRMLKEAGFDEAIIESQGGFFTTIALKMNYFSLRLAKGPPLVRKAIAAALWLPWQLSQWAALMLDRLDLHWELETPAYFVAAQRSLVRPVDESLLPIEIPTIKEG